MKENPDIPIVAVVSRLVLHKGLDLICEAWGRHDGAGVSSLLFWVRVIAVPRNFSAMHIFASPIRLAARIEYNEATSMRIYSGADLFLMPSKS